MPQLLTATADSNNAPTADSSTFATMPVTTTAATNEQQYVYLTQPLLTMSVPTNDLQYKYPLLSRLTVTVPQLLTGRGRSKSAPTADTNSAHW